ncbi:MAG: hypothetical protein HY430_01005 [Candidatus Levybacteria bacterium]|nr:hypothetical protein [Candidatus Levybacteria bacterium]
MEKKKTIVEEKPEEMPELMHDFGKSSNKDSSLPKLLGILLVVALFGVGSGFLLAQSGIKTSLLPSKDSTTGGSATKGKTFGSKDTKTFKDIAEGKLEEGGIDGEGQFHLVRPGGDSQNVYMTSSIVDLSEFKGRKIRVWGETQSAQKAGWLMDVGRVEVLQ